MEEGYSDNNLVKLDLYTPGRRGKYTECPEGHVHFCFYSELHSSFLSLFFLCSEVTLLTCLSLTQSLTHPVGHSLRVANGFFYKLLNNLALLSNFDKISNICISLLLL